MPGYANNSGNVGFQPAGDFFVPDTTQRFLLGQSFEGVDPYFGYGHFVYGKAVAAMGVGRLVFPSEVYTMTDIPNTAGLGQGFLVAKTNMAINTFGWFQTAGVCPVQTAASVATGVVVGIGAAGQAGTNSAGKQLNGTRVLQASTFTLTKAMTTQSGQPVVGVSNVDGLFVGLTASGTGISGTISAIDPSGRFITLSANATATGAITATFTYTNFLLVYIQEPFTQGAIL